MTVRAKFIPAPTYSPERHAPYRLLWVKVIIRAAYDYALWKDSSELRLRKFSNDAEKWLFDESSLENSFSNICQICGLPITKLRAWARGLTREQVKRFEFLERQGRDLLSFSLPNNPSISDGVHR